MFSIPYETENSIVINKSPEEIFKFITDFSSWPSWSPWMILEPTCQNIVTGTPGHTGHKQEWNGQTIGSGRMTLAALNANSEVNLNLEFLKPWKANSTAQFILRPENGGTKVTWSMHGTLPFFMFFMKNMMKAWIGNDFGRGLKMLKEKLETGRVLSKVDVQGVSELPGFYFVGIAREAAIKDLGTTMKEDFAYLGKLVAEGKLPPPKGAFDFTDKFDMVKGVCKYRACLSYEAAVKTNDSKLVTGYVPKHHALNVLHTGSYDHLGNAWGAAMSNMRPRKLRREKTIAMYEVYLNMPDKTKAEDLRTQVIIPVQ